MHGEMWCFGCLVAVKVFFSHMLPCGGQVLVCWCDVWCAGVMCGCWCDVWCAVWYIVCVSILDA